VFLTRKVAPPQPTSRPFIRQRATGPHWYGKWSRDGRPVVRGLGRAWVEPDGAGRWRRRRGRRPEGTLTESEAAARMLLLARDHHGEQTALETDERERRRRGVTFRELARGWLEYLEHEKGAKPSTLRDYRWMLAEPDQTHRRGSGRSPGLLLARFGDRPAREILTREVAEYLRGLDRSGASPRTVNKHRQVISAIYGYAMREDTHGMTHNPAAATSRRREPPAAVLDFYEPEEIEALARAAEQGAHRNVVKLQIADAERAARTAEDRQDAELYRVAAYTGLRLGELLAVRWDDVDLVDRRLVVQRALSDRVEGPTKSWQARFVPLADPAAQALARLAGRAEFTRPADYVFCNRLGRPLDGSALRRRFKLAAAGCRSARVAVPRAPPRCGLPCRPPRRRPLDSGLPRPLQADAHRALPGCQVAPAGHRHVERGLRASAPRGARRAAVHAASRVVIARVCWAPSKKSREVPGRPEVVPACRQDVVETSQPWCHGDRMLATDPMRSASASRTTGVQAVDAPRTSRDVSTQCVECMSVLAGDEDRGHCVNVGAATETQRPLSVERGLHTNACRDVTLSRTRVKGMAGVEATAPSGGAKGKLGPSRITTCPRRPGPPAPCPVLPSLPLSDRFCCWSRVCKEEIAQYSSS
jgi:integrase